jgi:hypothetical protein
MGPNLGRATTRLEAQIGQVCGLLGNRSNLAEKPTGTNLHSLQLVQSGSLPNQYH